MNEELKPCPFCGSPVEEAYKNYHGDKFYTCSNQSCLRKVMMTETAWNARPIEDALRGEVARLTAELKAAREALVWYADPANYDNGKPGNLRGLLDTAPTVQYWKCDNGERARLALEPRE